jgi:hypothetical protein
MMTSRPSARSLAIWLHQWAMAASSKPRPSLVTKLEPTLTTMRFALFNSVLVINNVYLQVNMNAAGVFYA